MASTFQPPIYLTCVLAAILCSNGIAISGYIAAPPDPESANSSHVGDLSDENPLNKIIEKEQSPENIEDRQRTYVFKKNGEVFHEYVEDHRDIHEGRMEQSIEAWQARRKMIKEALGARRNTTGSFNVSDLIDPSLDSEIKYGNLKKDAKTELGNETFHDLDVEEARRYLDNTMTRGNRGLFLRERRLMTKDDSARWPKAVLPYVIREEEKDNTNEIKRAMNVYEEKTCIRFVPWVDASTNEDLDLGHPGHLNFIKDIGRCWSYRGNERSKAGQEISCCKGTTCVHELGHALGLTHEQKSIEREGWIRVNSEVISQFWLSQYERLDDGSVLAFGYDLSSSMHYSASNPLHGAPPAMTVLYPELYIGDNDYYMFMELVKTYKCEEMEPCANFLLTCENDGYVSIVRGKCACRCPTGLDPETGCTSPIKVSPDLKMPSGQYALPKLKAGCPGDGDFKDGEAIHFGDGWNGQSRTFSLEGGFYGTKATHAFCTREEGTFETDPDFLDASDWPGGSYCILRKGGECPPGFLPGFVHYTDKKRKKKRHSGVLPDGVFSKTKTRLEFCCQFNGFTFNPMSMPVDKPFVLFAVGESCQEVIGMHVRREQYEINAVKVRVEGLFSHWHYQSSHLLVNHYCVYEPADMNCGDVITLDSANPTTLIEMSSEDRTDLECTWVVKGDHQDGTLVLEFDEFNIKNEGDKCHDKVEVRHAHIAQKGLIYCGENDKQSIRSITDKMMIKFSTYGTDTGSKFKAYVRWIPNSELCYDVNDRGVTYDGKVNYTRKFEPCLPWAEATECPHHPWKQGDELDNLEGNYCRNPDNSHRPWCYTALSGCQRNYCDVCSLEEGFDRESNCEELREQGLCVDDVAQAVHKCASTCEDLLPKLDPIQKFTDILCGAPTPPMDGVLVGDLKNEYVLGEEVSYTCKGKSEVFTKTCMSSGDWSSLGSICSAWTDYLDKQCPCLLEAKPTMCQEYPDFAEEFCAKTCGVSGSEGVQCLAATGASDTVESSHSTLNVGQFANYSCKHNKFYRSGSEKRACKPDGTLTGEEYVCKEWKYSTITIGLPVLEKQPHAIKSGIAFTGENVLLTITHSGLITAWEFYSNSPMETAFMVWRVVETGKRYQLVGKNVINTGNDAMERYEVPGDERIAVEKGDLIGIWNADEGGVHWRQCDAEQNPGYAGLSWGRVIQNLSDIVVGSIETFTVSSNDCGEFSFRAEVSDSE